MFFLLVTLFPVTGYAGYIKGTVAETESGFDFWIWINSDFLGETIKANSAEELPSVDKCSVWKVEFDSEKQTLYYKGSCLKKQSTAITKTQDQEP